MTTVRSRIYLHCPFLIGRVSSNHFKEHKRRLRMKRLFIFLMCLFSVSAFSAPSPNCTPVSSWPPSSPAFTHDAFCSQFASTAYCHCEEKYSSGYCHQKLKVKGIYNLMISVFGSLERACQDGQKDVDKDTCITQWHYYNDGQHGCPDV